MLVDTRTEYTGRTQTYINRYGDEKTRRVVQKRHVLDTHILVKAAALSLLVLAHFIVYAFLSPWVAFPAGVVFSYFYFKIFLRGTLKVERIETDDIAKSLRDEAGECVAMLSKLTMAATLTPEGSGIRARADQYGNMVWKVMTALRTLNDANDLVGAKSGNFYAEVTKMKTQLADLERSGYHLVELTASRRMDSVVQDIEFVGIQEFKTDVNGEMMTYRALGDGS